MSKTQKKKSFSVGSRAVSTRAFAAINEKTKIAREKQFTERMKEKKMMKKKLLR